MSIKRKLLNFVTGLRFPGSARYWELRYRLGEDSGAGSYGEEAEYKRSFISDLLERHAIASVIDFGCGDGNQLEGLKIADYSGFDVSTSAVERCAARYANRSGWRFATVDRYSGERADAALSLDVLYHLVEERVYIDYLERLFGAARRIVVIYASNSDSIGQPFGRHVRHRRFHQWIGEHMPSFQLLESPERPAHLPQDDKHAASFWIYETQNLAEPGTQNQ